MNVEEQHVQLIIREAVSTAVRETLLNLGLDTDDKIKTQAHMQAIREVADMLADPEYQADLIHLRRWRKSMDQVSNVGIKTAVGIVVTGFFGMVVFAVKAWLEK